MNLFVIGFGLSKETKNRVPGCLLSMCDVFPHIDGKTLYKSGDGAFVAGIHTANEAIAPRRYVFQSGDEMLLYDGMPMDTSSRFRAYDAKQLAQRWSSLPDVVEGQYCAARIRSNPESVEVLVDALGMYQLYYITTSTGTLLSNSIELINRITGSFSLDSLGAAYFLGLGWAAGDRTLRSGVRVVDPGEVWCWQADRSEILRRSYFQLGDYSRRPKRDFGPTEAKSLAGELSSVCRCLEEYGVEVECPITAGRDSRLLTALMNHNSIRANYFTAGPATSADVIAGRSISSALNLPHKAGNTHEAGIDGILNHWEAASERLLKQTDGMVTLAHIGNAMHPQDVDRRNIELYGAAGEIARPFYFKSDPLYYLLNRRPDFFTEKLIQSVVKPREVLLRASVGESVRSFIREFTKRAVESGFTTRDLDSVFYTNERARRWAGINIRTITSYIDVFVPLATRPYVIAALSIPAYQRYSERIPKALLHCLAPQLDSIPLQVPWHSQSRFGILKEYLSSRSRRTLPARAIRKIHRIATNARPVNSNSGSRIDQRSAILESRLNDFRSLCLDQTNSSLWELVDRNMLEKFLSSSMSSQDRRRHLVVLYDVFTLFQYTSAGFHTV